MVAYHPLSFFFTESLPFIFFNSFFFQSSKRFTKVDLPKSIKKYKPVDKLPSAAPGVIG